MEHLSKYILTLKLEASAMLRLSDLRTHYFPPQRNFLQAHITLFHALPNERRQIWLNDLIQLGSEKFEVQILAPYSTGRGVALRVESLKLLQLRKIFCARWTEFLSPHDRQGYRPHCTIQNKVAPAKAAATLAELQLLWQPLKSQALSLELWLYMGGPWRKEQDFLLY